MVDCALMKSTPNPEAARAFLEFLAGPEGQEIFKQTGFSKAE